MPLPNQPDYSRISRLPISFQEIQEFMQSIPEINLYGLRQETLKRIEAITKIPIICYVMRINLPPNIANLPVYIDHSDLIFISDLVYGIEGDSVDVLIISNGGMAEGAERIVNLIRERFKHVRFIVPSNAYSAATLICLSGDEILMGPTGTLGPIDPQINGIPARAILRAFDEIEQKLKTEGPSAIAAYLPLIEKYDLHVLEICKSSEALSAELAATWISQFMLRCTVDDPTVIKIVDYLKSYDTNKSHSRSINGRKAKELGLKVKNVEEISGLVDLIRSLTSQYEIWWQATTYYKTFEDSNGHSIGPMFMIQAQQPPQLSPLQR